MQPASLKRLKIMAPPYMPKSAWPVRQSDPAFSGLLKSKLYKIISYLRDLKVQVIFVKFLSEHVRGT